MQPTSTHSRFDRLDALRALAMLWMAGFHFCFDLQQFGYLQQNFYRDPFWTTQRNLIVSLFIFCAGISLAIALQQQQSWQRFRIRSLQLLGCALLVSIGSYFMFPKSYITFGILHGMLVMLSISRLAAPLQRWLWPLGLAALLLPLWIGHPWFDSRWTNWIGLVTMKPSTEDFVPLLPWIGVMFWGLATGQYLLEKRISWISTPLPSTLKPLITLGRWPLLFYMLHQPVLIGILTLLKHL